MSMVVPDAMVPQVAAGLMSAVLLGYPVSTAQVHPIVQVAICIALTYVGVAQLVGFMTGSCSSWWFAAVAILSLVNVIAPVVGSIVGLGTAFGLLAYVVASLWASAPLLSWIVALAVVIGMSVLFTWRSMFFYWQFIAPPVVGGFLAASAIGGEYTAMVWGGCALLSLSLHLRKFYMSSWLEKKRDMAVNGNESQITKLMRTANPNMTVEEYEILKDQLLTAVDGDKEQVDRVVFGGGLY